MARHNFIRIDWRQRHFNANKSILTFIKNSNSLLVLLFIAVYFVVVFVKRNDNLQILIKILGKTVIVADFPSIFMKNVFEDSKINQLFHFNKLLLGYMNFIERGLV